MASSSGLRRTVFESILILFFSFLLMTGCRKEVKLENVDATSWAQDKNGCNGYRKENIATLMQQKDKILGLNQIELNKVLGKPDKVALYKRSQRFYVYYLNGYACSGDSIMKQLTSMQIRLSAMDIANEIFIQEEFAADQEETP